VVTKDYSYSEVPSDLQKRIDAHKKYSEFSLEEFLQQEFPVRGKCVLDLGCGSGNFAGLFSDQAQAYLGVDKNPELIQQARSKYGKRPNVWFAVSDIDDPFPFPEKMWDLIFLIFSSYYSNNPADLFDRCLAALNTGGKVVAIGPGPENAKEIDAYCYALFKRKVSSEKRVGRISGEFSQLLKQQPVSHELKRIHFDLQFPSYEEYFEYISSTLQYRESVVGPLDELRSREILEKKFGLRLTKQVECLCGTK
jgi:SAM-dependent methyltransferase